MANWKTYLFLDESEQLIPGIGIIKYYNHVLSPDNISAMRDIIQ